jgi:hypothetical protein
MFEPALAGQSRPTGGSSDDLSDYDLLDEKTRFRGGIDQQTGKLTAAAGSEKVLSKAKQSTRAPTPRRTCIASLGCKAATDKVCS